MTGAAWSPPEFLPILSRGKHRTITKGACFMELASVLAGQRWSDRPSCTHPLLASLARLVNDQTSDQQRHRLCLLVPAVVGLKGEDPRIDARIALRCATTALPVAPANLRNPLAVSVLTAEEVLAGLDGRPAGRVEQRSQAALQAVPSAAEWAGEFAHRAGITVKGMRRHAAPSTVRVAVRAIARGGCDDPDATLRRLLTDVIDDCLALRDHALGGASAPAVRRITEDLGLCVRQHVD